MKWLKILSAVSYVGLLIYVVLFAGKRSLETRLINYIPFQSTYNYYFTLGLNSRREVYYFIANVLGNVILFLPLPAIISLVITHKIKYNILLVSLCLSVFIEITQYIFKVGVADIDDVLLNMVGAVLGLLFNRRSADHRQMG
ncbi:VanZ family protein [Hymenobacter sp. HDW8]|uniref:VanZ family protein n=1 Tax=Hymenobacter sp. HDW8 TaxID=2714932 RepID=UPI00140E760B|nr:VanZ family protein [Hymenobacter sp. HDW8]QIL75331.1 VanZ family protein [Hymenobacter sp. HDW8]